MSSSVMSFPFSSVAAAFRLRLETDSMMISMAADGEPGVAMSNTQIIIILFVDGKYKVYLFDARWWQCQSPIVLDFRYSCAHLGYAWTECGRFETASFHLLMLTSCSYEDRNMGAVVLRKLLKVARLENRRSSSQVGCSFLKLWCLPSTSPYISIRSPGVFVDVEDGSISR